MKIDSIPGLLSCHLRARVRSAVATHAQAAIAFAVLAGLATHAGAAEARSKPPLPPIPVDVVDGDVRVTGSVAITNTVPVVVQNDMAMQGTVEVVNDTLHQPFVERREGGILYNESSDVQRLDVPDGKRLIVELVTFRVETGEHGRNWSFSVGQWKQLDATGGTTVSFLLPIGERSFLRYGPERIIGAYPLTLRIDSHPGRTDEFTMAVGRDDVIGSASVFYTVHGYLVDL